MAEKKEKKPKAKEKPAAKEKVEKKPEEVKTSPEKPKADVSEKVEEKPKPETPEEKPAPRVEEKPKAEDLVDKVYDLVEIARSTGKIKRGTNEVTKSVERSEPKLVVIADDCDPPEILMHLPGLSNERDIPLVNVPSKKELGSASGLDVPCVAIAVVDGGEAKDILVQIRRQLKGTSE